MIYINPIGGLGNMFFHIASIWTLAKDNHDELCLLNIDEKIVNLMHDYRRNGLNYRYLFNRFPNIVASPPKLNYPFQFTKIEYKKNYEYCGYFQSEKYFKHRRNEILELFKPTNEIISKIDKYSNLFGNISLHIRRGDYLRNQHIHILPTIHYYNNAISKLPNDKLILIFSDDLNWCRQNFIGDRFIFIDEIDYISLYLMCEMKYHIVANSSFSWWGAWMSSYDNKIIIAPKKWFADNTINYGDLIPDNWIKI